MACVPKAKIPGEGPMLTLTGADVPLEFCTTTLAVPLGTSQGNCALIWSPLTGSWNTPESGAATPLKVTTTLFDRVVERGMELASALADARLVPKLETSEPGATACPLTK